MSAQGLTPVQTLSLYQRSFFDTSTASLGVFAQATSGTVDLNEV
jgi:hypothetical protein